MKYLALFLLSLTISSAFAQAGNSNPLLEESFWKKKPDVATVKSAIDKGANPSELNPYSFDPIVLAINNEAPYETIIFLMSQPGNDINKLTHDSRTYIFWAAYKGNIKIMNHLLSKGAKTDLVDSHGASPLTFAAGGGEKDTAVYNLLLSTGIKLEKDLNHDGANALLLGVGTDNDFALTRYFQAKGLDLKSTDANGSTAFDYAARSGNRIVMDKLLEKGVKPTDNAMIMAAKGTRRTTNKIEVFQYLERAGIKATATSKDGSTALHYLVRKPEQLDVVKYFLSKGAAVNKADNEGNTAFMNAVATNKDIPTIELLAASVTDINTTNKAGATALALALRGNTTEVVNFLINKGAGVNTADAKGNNMAYYLIESYSPRTAEYFPQKLQILKDKGLNLTAVQKDGNTLYHLAIAKNDVELVNLIAPLGADINAKNKDGFTALHKAAMTSKNDDVLKLLVASGAKKDVKTDFDETAYDLARENEYLSKKNISIEFLK